MIDSQLEFSNEQAITTTAASQNVIFLGKNREVAFGNPIPLLVRIKETFNNLTSLKIAVETAVDEAFTSAIELASTTVLLADLKEGNLVPLSFMPSGNKGYVRLKYTVNGETAPTKGKVYACLTDCVAQSFHDMA